MLIAVIELVELAQVILAIQVHVADLFGQVIPLRSVPRRILTLAVSTSKDAEGLLVQDWNIEVD